MRDILLIESIQRKFTKRIPDMSGLTYRSKLIRSRLESLEVRRFRADIAGSAFHTVARKVWL